MTTKGVLEAGSVAEGFANVQLAEAALRLQRARLEKLLAAVTVASEMLMPWLSCDDPRPHYPAHRHWVPRGHYHHWPPKAKLHGTLSKDFTTVHFRAERTFEGSDRHGSGDLEFEVDFSVPAEMIDRNDMIEIERHIKAQLGGHR